MPTTYGILANYETGFGYMLTNSWYTCDNFNGKFMNAAKLNPLTRE